MPIRNVLIVGCGIAGQTLAGALAKRGIAAEMVEIKEDWHIVGAGMYVQSNALRALVDIGVADEIVARGFHAADDVSHICDAQGNLLAAVAVPRLAGGRLPGVNPIRRQVLHEILQASVTRAGVPLRMGTSVHRIDDRGDRVEVGFTDGTSGRYDLVVGADGIRSVVRALAFGAVEPIYTGYANWRVLMPRPQWCERPTWYMGLGRSFGVVPLCAEYCYYAGVSKEPGSPRYEKSQLLTLMRARFAGFGGPIPALLAAVREEDGVYYNPIEEVLLPLPWARGRVVLVGDAAHASSPFWAQGASMAIEDVVVLAELLVRHATPEAVFAEWHARRHPRCLFVQQGSLETGKRSHDESPGALERIHAYIKTRAAPDTAARYARLAEPI